MSERSRVGILFFLSMASLLSSQCGGSSAGDSNGDGGAASGGGNCGMRAGMRGKTSRSLMVSGTARTYIAYLPQALDDTPALRVPVDATKAVPLVFVFHGAEMNGSEMYELTQYASLADREGIAVAFLDGQGTSSSSGAMALDPWNVSDNGAAVCGAGNFANNPTASVDFAFMDAIKADIAQDQCIDDQHVFATGFSMGGYFTHHVGCDRTDVRAVAPHSGGTIASLSSC